MWFVFKYTGVSKQILIRRLKKIKRFYFMHKFESTERTSFFKSFMAKCSNRTKINE